MAFAKKSFGQHFLRDQSVIEKIIAAAEIQSDDLVVEVGPGTGALTEHLEPRTENLILIESDRDLIGELEQRFPKAKIIAGDAAKVDYDVLANGQPWIFVSNLPYNAGNAIIMQVLTAKNPPKRLVVMVQREVGDRMLGHDASVLSVAVGLYAHVEKVCRVLPGAFVPPPKVDSVVLKLSPKSSALDRENVIRLAKAGFANRRKQLHKNLSEAGLIDSSVVQHQLEQFGLSKLARAEELSLEQWIELSKRLS